MKNTKDYKNNKIYNIFYYIVMGVLLIGICIFGYKAIVAFKESKTIDNDKKIFSEAITEAKELKLVNTKTNKKVEEKKDNRFKDINWNKLLKENKETVAYIDFPKNGDFKEISYPIVQTDNNRTYETKPFSANSESKYGSPFMNSYNKNNFSDLNTILYGHKFSNKPHQFTALKYYYQFIEENNTDKINNENNNHFYIYLPWTKENGGNDQNIGKTKEILNIKIIGITIQGADHNLATYREKWTEESFNKFLKEVDDESLYHFEEIKNIKFPKDDNLNNRLVTLYTCRYANGWDRYIITGYISDIYKVD